MLTLAQIKQDYDVSPRGSITSPGKFEGEAAVTVAAYHIAMHGFADQMQWPDETVLDVVEVDDTMRTEFGMDTDIVAVALEYSEQGFVYGTQMTAREIASLERENKRAWQNADETVEG